VNLEVEIKARCDSHALFRARLAGLGAEPGDAYTETDVYFAHPSRDFAVSGEAFRVRRSGAASRITYKGPRADSEIKTREEIELDVSSAEDMERVLNRLGFSEAGRVTKRREEYSLGTCLICLDTVDGLGEFVEIEATGTDRSALQNTVREMSVTLGITELEPRSYLTMVLGLRS
jgi:adenylate cyclase, class 2